MSDFHYNPLNAKIQGLSVQVGELFADMYRDTSLTGNDAMECLEAYKSLRRLLPREHTYSGARVGRHEGAEAAHKATQNES